MPHEFDLAIIGAGSDGLTAAGFAAQLGAKVALIEKNRIGGDCTWTGCVPSKALLKAAKIAHEVRTAARFGVAANPPAVDMTRVRAFVREAVERVYESETPEELRRQGIVVFMGSARFIDAQSIMAGEQPVHANTFLITTGARPRIPSIEGLNEVPFVTYEQIFDNDRLPRSMIIVLWGFPPDAPAVCRICGLPSASTRRPLTLASRSSRLSACRSTTLSFRASEAEMETLWRMAFSIQSGLRPCSSARARP